MTGRGHRGRNRGMVGVMRNLVMSFAIACVMTGLFTAMLWAQVSSVTFIVTP